ncbi:heavy metal-binding domain-containing protein [Polaribacter gangjinensis]|uniref:Heavy metal binding domain-containing protein n=1 Tax=Polaribacter gangjinensis TaxID=574710 RepID=A0A2S7WC12_9FLAO|nr:heavy metal-binding domain-containing protein [Polaribacter gangjinensis]PQJ75169.1 hypothetical protein BTO13_07875 [Polaribacter gangjinensis]
MKKNLIIIAIILVSSFSVISCKKEKTAPQKEEVVTEKVAYQCPMKCEDEKTYDKEGTCPVCKMKLKEKVSEEENHDHKDH